MPLHPYEGPLPLPGRDVHLQLVNPWRQTTNAALLIVAFSSVFLGGGAWMMADSYAKGLVVVGCGLMLLPIAGWMLAVAWRWKQHARFELRMSATELTVPLLSVWREEHQTIELQRISSSRIELVNRHLSGLLELDDGTRITLPQVWLPEGWDVQELCLRAAMRGGLVRHGVDAMQLAGAEAQVCCGVPIEGQLGAVVVPGDEGPTVLGLVESVEHYLEVLPELCAEHKLVVPCDRAEQARSAVGEAVVAFADGGAECPEG